MNARRYDGIVHGVYMVTAGGGTLRVVHSHAHVQRLADQTFTTFNVSTLCGCRTKLYGGGKTRLVDDPLNCLECIGEESHEK